ncbi:sensor histidine kinase [Bradyrhizobium sp. Arg816]|uniref:sensor histidine kinase n=1 Tax=Bradyrhizobium sp. Arg816 TaxID=2998491 RepID=UPI00249E740B|nr:sensor histidine kinase [Bradyrhizobium sp. Arg816]MDI3560629.1 sensor histidine kinase [Bradyrhizobium sp. Arg816]
MTGKEHQPTSHLRLADFIRQNQPAIIKEWTEFARTRTPASDGMSKLALQDHIVDILKFVANDLESEQTPSEQMDKSRGLADSDGPFRQSAAEIHAALRLADGFDIDQMVSEYRALRASVVKQWAAHQQKLAGTDLEDLTRFNEAIDQAVAESVAHYTKTINNSRNLFLGILGHDLRSPIGAASMAAQWMKRAGPTDPRHPKMVSDLVSTTDRASRILDDLFDLTRASFGTDIPVKKARTDMLSLCQSIVNELRSIHEKQTIDVTHEGDSTGLWDAARMGQVLSNLIGNAIQYSDASGPVTVSISGTDPSTLAVSVHNDGPPIPPRAQKTIFQSWMRGQVQDTGEHSHLGLGLYIAKLIVEAHGGEINVASDEATGTTFTIRLPRA